MGTNMKVVLKELVIRKGGLVKRKKRKKVEQTKTKTKSKVVHVSLDLSSIPIITNEQYATLVKHFSAHCSTSETPTINTAGKIKLNDDRMMDLGSIEHILSNCNILLGWLNYNHDIVTIPNGENVLVEGVGMTTLAYELKMENVIYIPSFNTNILYVSTLMKGLKCVMTFFHDFYVIEDLVSKKVIVTGESKNGLYHMKNKINEEMVMEFLKYRH